MGKNVERLAAVIVGKHADGFEVWHLANPENQDESFPMASISLAIIGTVDTPLLEQWRALTRQLIGETVRLNINAIDARITAMQPEGHA